MPPRRKPKPAPNRGALPPEVPESAKSAPPAPVAKDDDLLPEELQKMLKAAYT